MQLKNSVLILPSRRTLLIAGGNLLTAQIAAASTMPVYVSSTTGNDQASGVANEPVRTLKRAYEIAKRGLIALKRGDVWHEMLKIEKPFSIGAYAEGDAPIIDADGSRHGVLITQGQATIEEIHVRNAINGVYITGAGATASIRNVTCTACGSGIVAGGGGSLSLAENVTCAGSQKSLGAGDGIQISEDAGAGPHIVIRALCQDNEMSGINFKQGDAIIAASKFLRNGECGVLAQVNAQTLEIFDCVLRENNQSDNGTFNLALEDNVHIRSRRNSFIDPMGVILNCNNVNITGAASLTCHADEFYERNSKVGSSIRLAGDRKSGLIVQNCSFYADRTNGIVIDAYNAPVGAVLSVTNCAFWSRESLIIRYPEHLIPFKKIDHNCYFRSDDGAIVELQDVERFKRQDAFAAIERTGADRSSIFSDPMFYGPKGDMVDFTLKHASPARAKGKAIDPQFDHSARPYSNPPNIGSRSS